jgi:hypothetical protein
MGVWRKDSVTCRYVWGKLGRGQGHSGYTAIFFNTRKHKITVLLMWSDEVMPIDAL